MKLFKIIFGISIALFAIEFNSRSFRSPVQLSAKPDRSFPSPVQLSVKPGCIIKGNIST